MINTFIDVTTFGQTVGGTFDLTVENPNEQISLGNRRITPFEDCSVQNPVFEKNMQDSRIMACMYNQDPRQVQKLIKAFETETRRVNSLAMLNRELNTILSMEDQSKMILVYVPAELLREIDNGQYKFFLDGTSATTYYSEMELNLWRVVVQQIQALFHRIIFKNIASCKTNKSNSQIQGCRVLIYKEMYTMLLNAYKECKALKDQAIRNASGYNNNVNANNFNNNAFGGFNNTPSQNVVNNAFGGINDINNVSNFGSGSGFENPNTFTNSNTFTNLNAMEQGNAFGVTENVQDTQPAQLTESPFGNNLENVEEANEGVNKDEDFKTPNAESNIPF